MRERLLIWVLGGLGRLSFAFAGRLGALMGSLFYGLSVREARNAKINLAICFPDMDDKQRNRLLRENLRQTGAYLLQMLRLWTGRPVDVDRLVDENGCTAAARALLERGNGLIVAVPHMGNWELMAYWANHVAPMTVLYRPPRLSGLDAVVHQGRSRSGVRPVPIDRQGLKALHAALRRNEMIAILPDQVPKTAGSSSVVAPFFGRPALTMTLLGRLARAHAAPVLFCCAIREGTGEQHRIHHFVGDAALGDSSAEVSARSMNAAIECMAREFPEHYQWTYRRFEIPNDGLPNPYID